MEPKKNSFSRKLRCIVKIDYDFEDELLLEPLSQRKSRFVSLSITKLQPEDLESYTKFRLAVKKQVKEEYEHRGCQRTPCVIH